MKRRHVAFTKTAREHVRAAKQWWIENSLRPEILVREIEDAVSLPSVLPGAGSIYAKADVPSLRRVYLRRLTSHLYYTFTDDEVVIQALWHANRKHGPELES